MEWAMPRNAIFDSRIGDVFWYWVMSVRHHLVAAPACGYA
jgi:hypothetical protein